MRRGRYVLVLLGVATAVRVAAADIRLREVSARWGLSFRHHTGAAGAFFMPEIMGSGVGILDYDGDGDQDVLFVDGGEMPGYSGETTGSRLYRNDGLHFVDVTERSRLSLGAYGMGVAVGDVDGDGWPDLFISELGPNQLFRNRGDGSFDEVGTRAGVADPLWGASAALGDVDGDGAVDLYVANYVDFRFDDNPICGDRSKGLRSYCHPDVYEGVPDRLYRNRGDGTFEDLSSRLGDLRGKGLGVVLTDLTGDGLADIYVANDSTPNFFFRNLGGWNLSEEGLTQGMALGPRGLPEAGMGIAVGDLQGDALPDVMVTHLDRETNALYSSTGAGIFVDRRMPSHVAEPSFYKVGFGVGFADLDQDGDLDIVVANGHIVHNVELSDPATTFRQPNQVLANEGQGRFTLVEGSGMEVVRASRGLAIGDLDGDGDLDLAINDSDEPCEVYENAGATGHWLQVAASGGSAWQPGTVVDLVAGGRSQRRQGVAGSSYLSSHAPGLHFGLGAAARVDWLSHRGPGGRTVRYLDLPVNVRLVLAVR